MVLESFIVPITIVDYPMTFSRLKVFSITIKIEKKTTKKGG